MKTHKVPKLNVPKRRHCINERTKNFHFSVGFNKEWQPVEVFITGRGKSGTDLDVELYELGLKISKLMQGDDPLTDEELEKMRDVET